MRGKTGIALAGNAGIDFAAEPALLDEEGEQGEAEEHDRQGRGASGIMLRADDREEDLGREHIVIATQHQGVAEICQAFDEAEEERIGEPRAHQRKRDGAKRGPAIGAEGLRGFFEGRAYPSTTPISTRKAMGVKASI